MNSRLDFPSQAPTGTNPSGPALVDSDGDGKPTDVTACMHASRLRIDQEGSSLYDRSWTLLQRGSPRTKRPLELWTADDCVCTRTDRDSQRDKELVDPLSTDLFELK